MDNIKIKTDEKLFSGKETLNEVVIYQDRALINRKLDLKLDEGTGKAIFRNLPPQIERSSVRISGSGNAGVRVESFDIKDEYLEDYNNEEILSLEKELEILKDRFNEINKYLNNILKQKSDFEKISNTISDKFIKEFYYKQSNPEIISDFVNLFRANFDGLTKETIENIKEQRVLQKKISKVERILQDKSAGKTKQVISCEVNLNVQKNGEFSLYLTYVVYGAWWIPVYDARLDINKKEVEINYYGRIGQKCGEDWEKIILYLSTAKPSISASLPELFPRFVNFGYDIKTKNFAGTISGGEFDGIFPEPAELSTGEISGAKKSLSTTFMIKDTQDLPSDGTEKKVLISSFRFPVNITYRSFPKELQSAFIIGEIENTSDFPFLEGTIKVFHDLDYVGDSFISTVLPKEKVKLSLGADEAIKIKREKLKDFKAKKGITGGYTSKSFKYKINVDNYKNENIFLILEEPIPVSSNKEIKVELLYATNKKTPDYKGIIKWELELKPSEKIEIEAEYSVEYPKERTITGLDL